MTATTTVYAATVRLLLPGDITNAAEASDAVNALLTECGIYEDALLDWSYLSVNGVYRHPEPVEIPAGYDRDDDTIPGSIVNEPPAVDHDLLAALKRAEELLSEALTVHIYGDDDEIPEPGEDCECNYVNGISAIREAIAKAEGRA